MYDCKQFEVMILSKATPQYRTLSEIEPKKNKCFICGMNCNSDICHSCAVEFPIKKFNAKNS